MDVTEFAGLDNLQFSGNDWIPRQAVLPGCAIGTATGAATISASAGTVRGVAVDFDSSCVAGDEVEILDDTDSKALFVAQAADDTGYAFFSSGISCSTSIKIATDVTGNVTIVVFHE